MEIQVQNNKENPTGTSDLERTPSREISIPDGNENDAVHIQKSIELDEDLKDKLKDLPDIVMFIEKLQKIIQKQVKKIIKWKMKVKELAPKNGHNVSTQTPFDYEGNAVTLENEDELENGTDFKKEVKSLTEDIREAAEQAIQSSGFVYEETSGLYYDYNSGYYYNAEYGLYYDGTTGTYLKYNQETQSYEYHSQVNASETTRGETVNHKKSKRIRTKREKKTKVAKRQRRDASVEEPEEGECSDSSTSSNENSSRSDSSDISKQWPPCMRMIVESTDIPKIKVGSLFIVTCDGGTVGREGNHAISLPDINVSKHHLQVKYQPKTSKYMIVDLGSRNGTILNGKRMSSSKQESEPFEVPHGSKLQIGSTTLLCHIHEGSQTCGHCEPGLLMESEKEPPLPVGNSKKNINQQFKSELRRLRKQHGFLGSAEDTPKLGDGYTDRAQKRREEIGSQNPYEKTESASLDVSISSENKGFKLLSKMGWKEGQSLGKGGDGVTEPVKLVSNIGTAGIGVAAEPSIPDIAAKTKQSIWKKTQERFDKLTNACAFDDDGSDG